MEIDNEKRAGRAKMLLISLPFVLLLVTAIPALFLLIHTWIPTLISVILVIVGWGLTVFLRLTNVRFSFTDNAISLHYYPISPMTSSFKRIDIDYGKLVRFEIRSGMGGLKKDLVLYENISGQEASYPPVSVLLCDRETLRLIEESLSAYCSAGTSS